jgi:hypothetical protein
LILTCAAVPQSTAALRESLAEERDDIFSDIDILWDVPESAFAWSVATVRQIVERAGRIASFRADPDVQRSTTRRLFFVRFAATPLFRRLDPEVVTESISGDDRFSRKRPASLVSD